MKKALCFLSLVLAGSSAGQFVYVANSGSDNISAYAMNSATGSLTQVLGSPFAAGGGPRSVAVDPLGRFLYVANVSGGVSGYRINADTGGLVEMPGSPYPAGTMPWAVTVDRQGKFVFVANATSNNVSAFTIDAANFGQLTPVAGSPFPAGLSSDTGWERSLVVHPNSNYLYVVNFYSGTVSEFGINAAVGSLTPLPGSPFGGHGAEPKGAAIDPSGRYLYLANFRSSDISGYLVNATSGALSFLPGSPFPDGTPPFKYAPAGIAVDPLGQFVYVAQANGVVGYLLNAATGVLTPNGLPAFGTGPQHAVAMDPTGRFVYVAGTGVTGYSVNRATGALSPLAVPPLPGGTDPSGIAIATPAAGPCAPYDGDRDGDGICDRWERLGVFVNSVYLDLPTMGADPNHKDVFVQTDYMVLNPSGSNPGHSHQPKLDAMDRIIAAFSQAPVRNPDGTAGINLHVDCGADCIMNPRTRLPWGTMSRATPLPHQDLLGTSQADIFHAFDNIKRAVFPIERWPVFHYSIFAHDIPIYTNGQLGTSGIAPLLAPDFIVSLGSWANMIGSSLEQSGTFMHELGHNLALLHGGRDDINHKPNYLSVMNYSFQTTGLVVDSAQGLFDYSRILLPALNETNLSEPQGLNGGAGWGTLYYCPNGHLTLAPGGVSWIDWNCNNNLSENGVSADVNGDSLRSILTSHQDWDNLDLTGPVSWALGATPPVRQLVTERMTPAIDSRIPRTYLVNVLSPGLVQRPAGSTVDLMFTVRNRGNRPDTYSLSARSTNSWFNLANVPSAVSLNPGAARSIPIRVTIPAGTAQGVKSRISIQAASGAAPAIRDIGEAEVTALACAAPVIATVTPRPNSLWPPNGKMVPVALTATTSAGCGDTSCKITSVTSNEPVSKGGDWANTGNLTLNLRADRLGSGSGRIYTITVQCTDLYGQASTKTALVVVPHDQGK